MRDVWTDDRSQRLTKKINEETTRILVELQQDNLNTEGRLELIDDMTAMSDLMGYVNRMNRRHIRRELASRVRDCICKIIKLVLYGKKIKVAD